MPGSIDPVRNRIKVMSKATASTTRSTLTTPSTASPVSAVSPAALTPHGTLLMALRSVDRQVRPSYDVLDACNCQVAVAALLCSRSSSAVTTKQR